MKHYQRKEHSFFRSKALLNMTKREPKNPTPLSICHEMQKIWIKEKICHSAGNIHSDIDILQQKLILWSKSKNWWNPKNTHFHRVITYLGILFCLYWFYDSSKIKNMVLHKSILNVFIMIILRQYYKINYRKIQESSKF